MIYVSTTNVQGFIYYFGVFYLKIGKFYTIFQLGKGPIMEGPIMGPKISPGKSLDRNSGCHLSDQSIMFAIHNPSVSFKNL